MYDEVGDPSKLRASLVQPYSVPKPKARRKDCARYRQRRPTAQQERHDHTVPDTHFGSILQFPILDKAQGWGDKYGRLIGTSCRQTISKRLAATFKRRAALPSAYRPNTAWQCGKGTPRPIHLLFQSPQLAKSRAPMVNLLHENINKVLVSCSRHSVLSVSLRFSTLLPCPRHPQSLQHHGRSRSGDPGR
jgi:hypothetical protein